MAAATLSVTRNCRGRSMRITTRRSRCNSNCTAGFSSRRSVLLQNRLQVHTGKGDIVDVPYDGGAAALAALTRILATKRLGAEPYEPLGRTKCGAGCGYYDRCWKQAEARQDVSLVVDVDQYPSI
jgi:hypothetical protein